MFFCFLDGILLKHPVDGRLDHIRLGRRVEGSDDADRNFWYWPRFSRSFIKIREWMALMVSSVRGVLWDVNSMM